MGILIGLDVSMAGCMPSSVPALVTVSSFYGVQPNNSGPGKDTVCCKRMGATVNICLQQAPKHMGPTSRHLQWHIIFVHAYTCIAHIYADVYMYTYRYVYIHTCIHTYIITHIHACIHAYMQTDRHTYIQTDRQTDRQTDIFMYICSCWGCLVSRACFGRF